MATDQEDGDHAGITVTPSHGRQRGAAARHACQLARLSLRLTGRTIRSTTCSTSTNITNVTQAHIHMAPKGVNGGIVVWLFPSVKATAALAGRRWPGRDAPGLGDVHGGRFPRGAGRQDDGRLPRRDRGRATRTATCTRMTASRRRTRVPVTSRVARSAASWTRTGTATAATGSGCGLSSGVPATLGCKRA